ncbi:dipeptidase [Alicyclobacillus mengziensis]|uniref:Dipeptidase n=1 Tax=Alicyclobacillus mengziensis TaxID=2931921 RepID=A0A9X7W194_9BACL|nr:dipeptidase [Alicyclobacillus mengziensis]QSO48861.1 dipeptidase [Alicyclobacillus mengziensis]
MSATWQEYLDDNQQRFVDELLEFLRIPSVSTDSAYAGDVRDAAKWISSRMEQAGIEGVQIMETGGHPIVYGEWLHAEGQPTLLVYGHFDVQPADPLGLWTNPPFEPTVVGDLVYARGASDMKGNDLLPVIACEALLQTTGTIPVNIKFLCEGEEEIGSPSLEPFIAAHQDLLACDMVVCADGGVGSKSAPVVNVGRRGLIGLEVHVTSASTDLHSGGAGGIAPNAIHALTRVLDSMRDGEGRILVDGFYSDVRPLTEEDKADIAKYPFDPVDYQAKTGVKAFFGEPEFTPQERNTVRPTLEINGIWGGYQGEGTKTVIPREAFAKITCRLVPDQQPARIQELVAAHIRKYAPAEVDVTVTAAPGDAEPYVLDKNHPGLAALEEALSAASDVAPVHIRGGGTVPITAMFKNILGVDTITLGATLGHDGAHAPNEHYSLKNFARIQAVFCMLFEKIGASVMA